MNAREKVTFFQLNVYERSSFSVKMIYKRGRHRLEVNRLPSRKLCRVLLRVCYHGASVPDVHGQHYWTNR